MVQKYFQNSKKDYSINEKAITKWSFNGRTHHSNWSFDDKKGFSLFRRKSNHTEPLKKWRFNDSSNMSIFSWLKSCFL